MERSNLLTMRTSLRAGIDGRAVLGWATDADEAPDTRSVRVGDFVVPRAFTGVFTRAPWTFEVEVRIRMVHGLPAVERIEARSFERSRTPLPRSATPDQRGDAAMRDLRDRDRLGPRFPLTP